MTKILGRDRARLLEILGKLAGHVSVCWQRPPDSKFDYDEAQRAIEAALREIEEM